MVQDLCRRIYCEWGPRGIQTVGCRAGARCWPLASRWGPGGGCRCSPATCRAGAPSGRRLATRTARDRSGRWWTGDSAPKASVASPSRYGEVGGGEVVGGVAWTWVCGPLSDAHECDKRGRGPEHGGRGPGERADATGSRVGRGGGLDAGLVRSGSGERVTAGPAAEPRTAVKSRGCEVGPTCP